MPSSPPAKAEAPLILTIDAGTSSARALLYDARGRAVEGLVAQERYSIRTGPDGAVEDDPDAALERIWRCVDAALAQAGPLAQQIRAVAIDTLVSNILAIDAAGRPLTPLITYADTRNDADAIELRRTLDERAVHQRTGCLLRTSYWPARLAWFRRTQPDIWRAAARWITLGEYMELRLFGRCRVGCSVASWSGLLDRRRLEWDAPLLDFLGVARRSALATGRYQRAVERAGATILRRAGRRCAMCPGFRRSAMVRPRISAAAAPARLAWR